MITTVAWQAVLLGATCTFALLAVELHDILHAVLALLAMSVCLAGLFWLMSAPFLAVFQLLIYGGAIVALFIVTVTLTGARARSVRAARRDPVWVMGGLICVAVLVLAYTLIRLRPFQTLGYAQLPPAFAEASPSIVIQQVSHFLWKHRGLDLIAQGFVSLAAALGCIALLRPRHEGGSGR
jgi:NADH:ubiquinone oxidoreductase subunit 6 (subunit J)